MRRLLFILLLVPAWLFAQVSPPPLPPQSGHSGQYLTTNGAKASWSAVASGRRVTSLSSSSSNPTFTISATTTDIVNISATGSTGTVTFAAPSPSSPNDGDQIEIRITCTNAQTYAWNAIFAASTSLALPTAATGSGKTDKILFEYSTAASKWQLQATNFGF
jgi:hypothetical protein